MPLTLKSIRSYLFSNPKMLCAFRFYLFTYIMIVFVTISLIKKKKDSRETLSIKINLSNLQINKDTLKYQTERNTFSFGRLS